MEPRPARRAAGPRDRAGQAATDPAARPSASGLPVPRSIPAPPGPRPASAGGGLYPPSANDYGPDPTQAEAAQAMLLLPREVRHRRRVLRTAATVLVVLLLVGGGAALLLRGRLFGAEGNDPRLGGVAGTPTAIAAAPPVTTAPPTAQPTRTGSGRSVLDTEPPTAEPPTTATAGDEPPADTDDPAEPTPPPADEEENEPVGERELADLLPNEGDLPAGLVGTPFEQRTLDEVAVSLGTEDAVVKLDEWGWEEDVVQAFALPADVPAEPGATTNVIVSIHRFATPEDASEAFVYFSDILVDLGTYEEFPIDPVGDETRLLKGAPDGPLFAVVYMREGNLLYRIGGSSPDGDPEADVRAVAQLVVEQ